MANLWNYEEPITKYIEDFEVPAWIEQDISPCNIASILQGGCASGAYMPAVTYHSALETMNRYGDEILDFIEETGISWKECCGDNACWAGIACNLLSTAVELWASSVEDEISEALDLREDEEE